LLIKGCTTSLSFNLRCALFNHHLTSFLVGADKIGIPNFGPSSRSLSLLMSWFKAFKILVNWLIRYGRILRSVLGV